MNKKDITKYSDNELSLWVFNDEALYSLRRSINLKILLEQYFIFTDEQFEVLEQDLKDDLEAE